MIQPKVMPLSAAHRDDPRICRQELHRLWLDHGLWPGCDFCALLRGDLPEQISHFRLVGRLWQMKQEVEM
jgi:hypothetical protein